MTGVPLVEIFAEQSSPLKVAVTGDGGNGRASKGRRLTGMLPAQVLAIMTGVTFAFP